MISNVVVNKNWTLVICNYKGKIIYGSFLFFFSVLPLVVMCLLLVLFVLKLK